MTIYLPIAEIPFNIFLLLFLGSLGGIMAGMFGVGGGFLVTPLLIFSGVSPAVAVATVTNQITASSFSGFLTHFRRGNVDVKMGLFLLFGGFIGSIIGVQIFTILKQMGQIDVFVSIFYVIFLFIVGIFMMAESLSSIIRSAKNSSNDYGKKPSKFNKVISSKKLPWVVSFPKSYLKVSVFVPVIIGIFSGILVSLMGIGGGFVMVPVMLYILKMPNSVVVGTSLFQIIFTTGFITILHAVKTQTVDIVLSSLLMMGGVLGAQLGIVIGSKLKAEKLRIILAMIVLAVCFKLGLNLLIQPENLYTIEEIL